MNGLRELVGNYVEDNANGFASTCSPKRVCVLYLIVKVLTSGVIQLGYVIWISGDILGKSFGFIYFWQFFHILGKYK